MVVEDKQKKNQKRNEKRRRNRTKKTQSVNEEVKSATDRISKINEVIMKEYGKPQKNKFEFIVSRNVIEILRACSPNNGLLPECYSLYECELISDISQVNDSTPNYIYLKDDGTMSLVVRTGAQVKNTKSKTKNEITYSLCAELLSEWSRTKIWIVPNKVWSDKKGYGRGLKRRLSSILEIPETSGYGLNYFLKDLELMKNGKSITKNKIWVEENYEEKEDIEESFKRFLKNVNLKEDGFIPYDDLKTYRTDKSKTKFNDLITSYFSDSVERGARQSQKRGFKGLEFVQPV